MHAPDSLKKLENLLPSVASKVEAGRIFFVSSGAAELDCIVEFLEVAVLLFRTIFFLLESGREKFAARRELGARSEFVGEAVERGIQ